MSSSLQSLTLKMYTVYPYSKKIIEQGLGKRKSLVSVFILILLLKQLKNIFFQNPLTFPYLCFRDNVHRNGRQWDEKCSDLFWIALSNPGCIRKKLRGDDRASCSMGVWGEGIPRWQQLLKGPVVTLFPISRQQVYWCFWLSSSMSSQHDKEK